MDDPSAPESDESSAICAGGICQLGGTSSSSMSLEWVEFEVNRPSKRQHVYSPTEGSMTID